MTSLGPELNLLRVKARTTILALVLLATGAEISGQTMPFAKISTAAIMLTFIALAIRKELTAAPVANPTASASQT